jgi:nucleoside phosphorylase
MKMLITFATLSEAKSSIEALKAKTLIENELYQTEVGKIIISGMGCLNAAVTLSKYVKEDDTVYNFGACGALKDLPLFSVIEVKEVCKFNFLPEDLDEHSRLFSSSLFNPIKLQENGLTCLSSDFPLHKNSRKRWLCENYDIIDMEGYGIAKMTKNVKMFKCVSDFASENGHKLIKENLKEVSFRLKETLIYQLG